MRERISRGLSYVGGTGLGPFLVRAMAGSGAIQFGAMAVTFLVGVQLARGLGVEGYGQYAIAMAVIALASVPAEFGLPKLVTREVAAASAQRNTRRLFGVLNWSERACYLMSAAMAALVVAGTLLVYGPPTSPLAAAILWGVPVIPLAALARLRGAALQGLHHVVLGQIPPVLLRPLLFSILLLALFALEPDASAAHAMALNGITAAAALILGAIWLRQRIPERPATREVEGRRWLQSAGILGLANGITVVQSQLTILVLALLASEAEVGLLRIGLSTILMVAVPITLVATVTSPLLSGLFSSGDGQRLQKLAISAVRAQFAGVLLLSLPLLLAGEQIIGLVFGEEFEPAAAVLRVLCIGEITSAAFGVNASLLKMTGNERYFLRSLGVGLIVNIGLSALLIPSLGSVGAAWGYTGSLVVWNIIAWVDARRTARINTILR